MRKRAARALIEVATTRGIQQAIDWYGFNDGYSIDYHCEGGIERGVNADGNVIVNSVLHIVDLNTF